MIAYYGLGIAGAFVSYLAIRCETRSRLASFLLYCITITLFCHFAGARDLTVGTDTAGYGLLSYQEASLEGLDTFYANGRYASWAPLYKLLCWFSVNVFHSLYAYLFVIQLFTVAPLVIASRKLLGNYLPISILVYAFMFYPMSLNMMRQMIAMSFLLLSFAYILNRKLFASIGFVVVAVLFHTSAIIGLAVYPLVSYSRASSLSNGLKLLALSALMVAVIAAAPRLLLALTSTGFYAEYSSGIEASAGGGFRTIATTFAVLVVLGFASWLLTGSSAVKQKPEIIATGTIVVFGVLCLPLSLTSFWLYRIGMTFLYYAVLLLPMLINAISGERERFVFCLLVIITSGLWSLDYYSLQGNHQVIPYLLSMSDIH